MADVYDLFDRTIAILNEKGKVSRDRTYREAKNSFKKFKSKLNLANVTFDFLMKYENYTISKGKTATTISIYIRH